MGCKELLKGHLLKQLLHDNVQKVASFSGHLDAVKLNTQRTVDNLEAQYLEIADKLTDKIEAQHQEQIERRQNDKRKVKSWLSEYVDEVKRVKQRVKTDPIEQMQAQIEAIKEAQLELQETVFEQIKIEVNQKHADAKFFDTLAVTQQEIEQ